MKTITFLLLFVLCTISSNAATPAVWEAVAPEIVARPVFENAADGLKIRLVSKDSLGSWVGFVPVKAGNGCGISAEAKVEGLAEGEGAGNDCMVLASWFEPGKKDPRQRDYIEFTDQPDGTRAFNQTFLVPENCDRLRLELVFKWRKASATFRNVQAAEVAPPAPRLARIVAANAWNDPSGTLDGNRRAMEETLQNIFREVGKTDLILFSECFVDSNVKASYPEKAEPLPGGPTFELLSRYAREHQTWICANIHEATPENVIHNTSFLVNREGKLAGIYRKVHLSTSEAMKGIIPGDELPVFETDFGKIGIVICWDNWFSETAKLLRLKGAEILLFPLAGDGKESHWSKIWSARAIDSSVPLVVSTQQSHLPAVIVDRDGEWLAETTEKNGFAFKELDLNERKRSFWLSVGPSFGDPYQLYKMERRPEVYAK